MSVGTTQIKRPRTLADIRRDPRVASVDADQRCCDWDGTCYWVQLADGWMVADEDIVTIHEMTIAAACSALNQVRRVG